MESMIKKEGPSEEEVQVVAEEFQMAILRMAARGLPFPVILAQVYAETCGLIAATYGGAVLAKLGRIALAELVEQRPQLVPVQ